jgi:hypothetical protein
MNMKKLIKQLLDRVRLMANDSAPDFGTGKTFDFRKMVLSLLGLGDQADEGSVMNAYNACMATDADADKVIKSKVAGMEKANEDLAAKLKEKEELAANETKAKTDSEAKVIQLTNEKTALEKRATDAEGNFANERAARINLIVTGWTKAGQVTGAEVADIKKQLANAKDFDAEVIAVGKRNPRINTDSITVNLTEGGPVVNNNAAQEFQKLVANEMTTSKLTYEAAWANVKKSDKGKALMEQMKQPEKAQK